MDRERCLRYAVAAEIFLLTLLLCFGKLSQGTSAVSGEGITSSDTTEAAEKEKDYIKWVEFNVTCEAMNQAYTYDTETYGTDHHLDWIELLAYLGTRYGGDFKQYKAADMDSLADKLLNGASMDELTKDMKYYSYYQEAYDAVLGGLVGEYEIEAKASGTDEGKQWVSKYGLKGFSPIAKGFPYSDYDDFGAARSYGYKRNHLGHDMMGQVGTPIAAVESGYITAMGWNQYGGWRLGISSFDGKRYYYYAHLRQNFPYCKTLKEGDVVQAGDIIGYMGRTGYSTKENVNNIDTYHLHFGLQLIFDESQREGIHEIWVDCYQLVRFLYKNQTETVRDDSTKEWKRIYQIKDPSAEKFQKPEDPSGKGLQDPSGKGVQDPSLKGHQDPEQTGNFT